MRILIITFFKKKFFLLSNVKRKLISSVEVSYDNNLTQIVYNAIKATLEERAFSSSLYKELSDNRGLMSIKGVLRSEGSLATLDLASLVSQKTAVELPVYLGKILFIKQQRALVCLVCFFQPPKGSFKLASRKKKKLKRSLRSLNAARYLKFNQQYNPLFFYKNTF